MTKRRTTPKRFNNKAYKLEIDNNNNDRFSFKDDIARSVGHCYSEIHLPPKGDGIVSHNNKYNLKDTLFTFDSTASICVPNEIAAHIVSFLHPIPYFFKLKMVSSKWNVLMCRELFYLKSVTLTNTLYAKFNLNYIECIQDEHKKVAAYHRFFGLFTDCPNLNSVILGQQAYEGLRRISFYSDAPLQIDYNPNPEVRDDVEDIEAVYYDNRNAPHQWFYPPARTCGTINYFMTVTELIIVKDKFTTEKFESFDYKLVGTHHLSIVFPRLTSVVFNNFEDHILYVSFVSGTTGTFDNGGYIGYDDSVVIIEFADFLVHALGLSYSTVTFDHKHSILDDKFLISTRLSEHQNYVMLEYVLCARVLNGLPIEPEPLHELDTILHRGIQNEYDASSIRKLVESVYGGRIPLKKGTLNLLVFACATKCEEVIYYLAVSHPELLTAGNYEGFIDSDPPKFECGLAHLLISSSDIPTLLSEDLLSNAGIILKFIKYMADERELSITTKHPDSKNTCLHSMATIVCNEIQKASSYMTTKNAIKLIKFILDRPGGSSLVYVSNYKGQTPMNILKSYGIPKKIKGELVNLLKTAATN
jgi:hypothetical protein